MIGPVKQEILSGYSDMTKFQKLKAKLAEYPLLEIHDDDYVRAAEYHNLCRQSGIQGSHTDFLICAVAFRTNMPILTIDKDFERYSRHVPIEVVMADQKKGYHG